MKNSFMLRVLRIGEPERPMRIDSPQMALRYWNTVIKQQSWFDEKKELLVALLLNTRYHIEGYSLVSIGSLNESIAHPREIFRAAIGLGAYAVIVAHNHPSGDPSPSKTDLGLFVRIIKAGKLLQIKVLDQMIFGGNRRYFSLLENHNAKEEEARRRRRKLRKKQRERQAANKHA